MPSSVSSEKLRLCPWSSARNVAASTASASSARRFAVACKVTQELFFDEVRTRSALATADTDEGDSETTEDRKQVAG